jgi:hypothetical protein
VPVDAGSAGGVVGGAGGRDDAQRGGGVGSRA